MAGGKIDVPGDIRGVEEELGVQKAGLDLSLRCSGPILQSALLSTPGSHKEELDARHSAESDT